jgi:hypothetical protein
MRTMLLVVGLWTMVVTTARCANNNDTLGVSVVTPMAVGSTTPITIVDACQGGKLSFCTTDEVTVTSIEATPADAVSIAAPAVVSGDLTAALTALRPGDVEITVVGRLGGGDNQTVVRSVAAVAVDRIAFEPVCLNSGFSTGSFRSGGTLLAPTNGRVFVAVRALASDGTELFGLPPNSFTIASALASIDTSFGELQIVAGGVAGSTTIQLAGATPNEIPLRVFAAAEVDAIELVNRYDSLLTMAYGVQADVRVAVGGETACLPGRFPYRYQSTTPTVCALVDGDVEFAELSNDRPDIYIRALAIGSCVVTATLDAGGDPRVATITLPVSE